MWVRECCAGITNLHVALSCSVATEKVTMKISYARTILSLPLLSRCTPSYSPGSSRLFYVLVPRIKGPRKHHPITLVHLPPCYLLQVRNSGPADSTIQFIFYQPIIHRWRETDFFPCSATCGGGNGVYSL